jgi:ATP-dependent Clp protease ATP-binding subunit ClpA
MFERFTEPARAVLAGARREALDLGDRQIGTHHLLLSLLNGQDDIAATVLRDSGVSAGQIREEIGRLVGAGDGPLGTADAEALQAIGIDLEAVRLKIEESFGPGALQQPPPVRRRRWPLTNRGGTGSDTGHISLTPRAKKVIELALREALNLNHRYIGTEHLLLGLLREGDGMAARALTETGLTIKGLRQRVHAALGEAA